MQPSLLTTLMTSILDEQGGGGGGGEVPTQLLSVTKSQPPTNCLIQINSKRSCCYRSTIWTTH